MKLKELQKFADKQAQRLSDIEKEISVKSQRLEEISKRIDEAIVNADTGTYKTLIAEKAALEADVAVEAEFIEKAEKCQNPFYTAEDVKAGWNEENAAYQRELDAARGKIEKLVSEAYKIWETMRDAEDSIEKQYKAYARFLHEPTQYGRTIGNLVPPNRACTFRSEVETAIYKVDK